MTFSLIFAVFFGCKAKHSFRKNCSVLIYRNLHVRVKIVVQPLDDRTGHVFKLTKLLFCHGSLLCVRDYLLARPEVLETPILGLEGRCFILLSYGRLISHILALLKTPTTPVVFGVILVNDLYFFTIARFLVVASVVSYPILIGNSLFSCRT